MRNIPTIGRVVHYYPDNHPTGWQPHAGIIVYVHGPNCINVAAFDAHGNLATPTSVPLLGEGVSLPTTDYGNRIGYACAVWPPRAPSIAEAEALPVPNAPPENRHPLSMDVPCIEVHGDAPRVTPDDIDNEIAAEYIVTADKALAGCPLHPSLHLLTLCVLVLRNGFTVVGKSACVSPENFDADIGKAVAMRDARDQVWPLLGYALRNDLYRATLPLSIPVSPEPIFADAEGRN